LGRLSRVQEVRRPDPPRGRNVYIFLAGDVLEALRSAAARDERDVKREAAHLIRRVLVDDGLLPVPAPDGR
jgi:hypothetical protein